MIVLLILTNAVLNVVGQLLLKTGINRLGDFQVETWSLFFVGAFTSPFVVSGLFLYACSLLVWFVLLSKVDLSFAYPSIALSYVLILFFSWLFLNESISLIRLTGVLFIIFGVFLVFRS